MDVAAVFITPNTIKYAGANRSLLYFNHQHQLQEIKPTKTPIGGSHIETVDITVHTINRNDVAQLYLTSDGFADQFGGSQGKKLMVSQFKLWLSDVADLPSEDQYLVLKERFNNWKGNAEQVDDVMVIGIKL
jgi:hypothetical protein